MRKYLFTILGIVFFLQLQAQDIVLSGKFLKDTLKIGEPVPYSLTARYPQAQTVIFPDENLDYGLFEFEDIHYFPTKTTSGISLDSAIYYLSTFEIDSVLAYTLPVLVINQNDSSLRYPAHDSIFVKQMVAFVPDSLSADALPLLTNTTYYRVKQWLNTPLILTIIIILVVAIILVWVFFGKRIRTYFKVRKLKKQYLTFIERYDTGVFKTEQSKSIVHIEEVISIWKKYIERISELPFTKLTSKEILKLEKFQTLKEALRELDLSVYANQPLTNMNAFMQLKNFATLMFEEKLKETSLGKR